jgi:hypothetical protein
LTCSEVQHLFAALLARPVGDLGPGCAGRCGADSRHAPAAATTDDKPPGDRAAPSVRAWRPASLGLPSELAILAGALNLGFQLFYLADSEAMPAELLSTGLELLFRLLLEAGPDTTARSSAAESGTAVSGPGRSARR